VDSRERAEPHLAVSRKVFVAETGTERRKNEILGDS